MKDRGTMGNEAGNNLIRNSGTSNIGTFDNKMGDDGPSGQFIRKNIIGGNIVKKIRRRKIELKEMLEKKT